MQFDLWFTLFVCVVGLLVSAGGVLLLVGYLVVLPASVTKGWRWVALTVLLPVFGPIWFCRQHWDECAKTGKQLMAGMVMLLLAVGMLYGLGPTFAARAMANVDVKKLKQANEEAPAASVAAPAAAVPPAAAPQAQGMR